MAVCAALPRLAGPAHDRDVVRVPAAHDDLAVGRSGFDRLPFVIHKFILHPIHGNVQRNVRFLCFKELLELVTILPCVVRRTDDARHRHRRLAEVLDRHELRARPLIIRPHVMSVGDHTRGLVVAGVHALRHLRRVRNHNRRVERVVIVVHILRDLEELHFASPIRVVAFHILNLP